MLRMIQPIESPDQIESVAKLAKKIWFDHYVPIIGEDQVRYMVARYQSKEAIEAQIQSEGYAYYGVYDNDNLAGYFSLKMEADACFLSKYYIDDAYRGQGLGRLSMDFIENLCCKEGKVRIYLTVNKHNTHTMAIYKKLGFILTGTLVTDIGAGFVMDDCCFEKAIATRI